MVNDDIIFETELIRQVEINIDYILLLVKNYHESNCKNKEILVNISKEVSASMHFEVRKKSLRTSWQASMPIPMLMRRGRHM